MMYVRMPSERVGVAIGPNGETKREIERRTHARLTFDSEVGSVQIEPGDDPVGVLKAQEILKAIARGFSAERALRLSAEDQFLEVIDITDFAGDSERAISRLKGRLPVVRKRTARFISLTASAFPKLFLLGL